MIAARSGGRRRAWGLATLLGLAGVPGLSGCGIDEPLMQPNPPPGPPPQFKGAGENEVTVSGTISTVSGETRSWVQVGDGQTVIGHLPATGVLTIDGRTSVPSDLETGMSIVTHGHQQGDLVVVIDATATRPGAAAPAGAVDPAVGAPPTTAAPGTATPAPAAPEAPPPAAVRPPAPTRPAPTRPAPAVTPAPATPEAGQ